MPQESKHGFKGKYPQVRAGTLEPLRIKDIFIKKWSFFAVRQRFEIRVRHLMTSNLEKR